MFLMAVRNGDASVADPAATAATRSMSVRIAWVEGAVLAVHAAAGSNARLRHWQGEEGLEDRSLEHVHTEAPAKRVGSREQDGSVQLSLSSLAEYGRVGAVRAAASAPRARGRLQRGLPTREAPCRPRLTSGCGAAEAMAA
eukprot:6179159-Pleurochrysis_carterae.AAC.2